MFSNVRSVLDRAERVAGDGLDAVLPLLRTLSIDEFGEVMFGAPNTLYPGLARVLPRMAAEEVQRAWTGSSGVRILRESLMFVRILWHAYERITGNPLSGARILDYGCGYGRLLRLMLYFTNPDRLHGCDPWGQAIDLCRQDGVPGDLRVSDYLPHTLPYAPHSLDMAYAFSVFTHTSRSASVAALAALAGAVRSGGLLCLTLRPPDYWDFTPGAGDPERKQLKARHAASGFAFRPHNVVTANGGREYGDTTMAPALLESWCGDWKLVSIDRTIVDPYQLMVFLQRKPL